MKKIVQFLFVSVMILFVGLPARAQDLADGDYYIKAADGSGYLAPSNNWGTRASLVPHSVAWKLAKLSDGSYSFESCVNNGGTQYYLSQGEEPYCDNGNAAHVFIKAASGSTYYLSSGAADANFFKKGDNGPAGLPLVMANAAKATDGLEWQIVSCNVDPTKENARKLADGEDATFIIQCANFDRNNRFVSAWGGGSCGGNNENMNTESYMAAFDRSQTLSVPNGYYKVTAQAAVTYHDNRTIKDYVAGDATPVIYANSEEAPFFEMASDIRLSNQGRLSTAFSAGEYTIPTLNVTVTDNTLKIGAKSTRADIWAVWDNFTLVYVEALDAPVRRDMIAAAEEGDKLWAPANTEINKLNKDYANFVIDFEYESTVLGEKITIANAMYKANQDLVNAKDMIDAKYAEGEGKLYAAKQEIQALINEAKALIAEAQAKAQEAHALAKDLAEVSKALPAGGYYLMNDGATYLGYAGGDRGSKVANVAHPVEWIFAPVSKYGAYTFESAVADGDKFYFDGTVADGEETTIYISKAIGFDAANPTFVLALGKGEKFIKPDYSTTDDKTQAAVWTIKSTALKDIKEGDVTYLIKDANFDSNRNQAAWSFSVDKGEGGNDGNLRGGKNTNFCAETYKSAFTLSQKLTGIPNGYYTLKAKGATSKEFGPFFTANSERFFFAVKGDEGNLDAMSDAFAAGKYEGKVEVQVNDGTLEIGAQNSDKSLWVIFDDFSLYYNGNNSTAYNLQVGDSVAAAWDRLDAKYEAIKAEGDPQFDVDAKGKAGAIRAQIDLIKSNTTQKEIEVTKKVDGQDKKVKVMVDTGHGIDQLMPVAGTPGTSYADGTGTAYSDKSFIVKSTDGKFTTVADSLYAKMDGIYTLLDNYQENAAARDELNDAIADLKTLWQAVYDLGNVRYGDVAKDYTGEFAEQVAEFRGEFEENLIDLNAIDLNIAAIADQVNEYFFAGTVVNKVDEIKQALAEQKTNIEDELGEIQAESKDAVDGAAAEKIAIYDAAITVINQHYKDQHAAIAKETNDKLFEIHKAIVAIQDAAALEYEKDVVKANNEALAANALPTAFFKYADYLEALEKVRTDLIKKYLTDADVAAHIENDDLVDEYKNGFYVNGELVDDGLNQLIKRFADAQNKLVSDINLDDMKKNEGGKYYEKVQAIATDLVTLRDTLAWYGNDNEINAHTKVIPGGVDQVHATFAAPANTNTTWDPATSQFTWSTTYYNQLRNIGLPNGDVTDYKKLVVDCNITSGERFRILIYQGDANRTLYAYNGKNEYDFSILTVDANGAPLEDFLKNCTEICLSGNNAAAPGAAIINDVYLETYPDPATTKDTIICIYDAAPYLDELIAKIQDATDELAEIVEYSDEKKAELADDLSELRATWNQAKVGLIEVDPEVAAEDGLQKAYEQIDAIDLELKAPEFYYDEEAYEKRKEEMYSAKLRLENYDQWVEEYTLDGDLNVDGDVTVTDVLLGIQYNLGNAAPQSKQEKYAAYAEDWKKADAKVDAVRLMEILNIALGETYEEDEEEVAAKARVKAEDLGEDYLVKDGAKMNLVNATQFYIFEMDVTVADGSALEATLGERASKLNLYTSDRGNGKYHLLAMSLKKAAIADNEGTLFELNNENVTFSDIQFVDAKAKKYVLDVVNASDIEIAEEETAIADIKAAIADGKAAIYTANGAQVANLQKGVNIVKFTNGSVRKVFVK